MELICLLLPFFFALTVIVFGLAILFAAWIIDND